MFVVTGPSGVGKTSLVRALIELDDRLVFSISHTTRPRRVSLYDVTAYHFITDEEFENLEKDGQFLEYATVFGYRYGTSRSWVEAELCQGRYPVLDIDWQGAAQIRKSGIPATSIYILPPSYEELERRLRSRREDSDEIIAHRMSEALEQISHYHEFDYVIVNRELDESLYELREIVNAVMTGYQGTVKDQTSVARDLLARKQ